MPRFNPDKWKPVDDTSPGYRTLDPHCVVLHVAVGVRMGCPCGCGDFPTGAKAVFCMGHDARFRGVLIRAHLMGAKIRYYAEDVLGDPTEPMTIAEQYHWKSYLDAAVMRREGANRDVLRKTMGSDRLIQVGRWEYTGQVVAVYRLKREDMVELEYVNKAGEVRKLRTPVKDAPLAQGA